MKIPSFLKTGTVKHFTSAAFLIGGLSFVSSFLGLIRDRVLAARFGAGDILDIYYAAFRLPDLVFNIVIFGALSSAFVPIFSKYLTKSEKQAFKIAGNILNLVLILIIIISAIAAIFAPWIVKLIVPGFPPDKLETTVELTRIMFLSPILLSISGVFSGVLTTFKRFLIYSLAPVMYNIGIISGIFIFTPIWGIHGLALAVVFGAFLHMMIQLPAAVRCGFKFTLGFDLKHEAIRSIWKLMLPRSLSLMVTQFNLLFITIIASILSTGSLAIFNLANNLATIPLTIFGAPFAVAVFPDLAYYFNTKKMGAFIDIFSKAFTRIAFFVVPSTVIILTLRAQLVRLILGSGEFDWQDTTLTFQVLGFLVLSLFFQSLIPLLSRAFFALHNTLVPFIAGVSSAVLNVALAYFLGKELGVAGIALAYSISQTLNFLILLIILYLKVEHFDDHEIISAIVKICFASLVAGLIVQTIKHFTGSVLGTDTFVKVMFQAGLAGAGGLAMFFGVTWLLGFREVHMVKQLLGRMFRKS